MQQLLARPRPKDKGYIVCSAYPRLVDGKPSKNPRYLQLRPDLAARGPVHGRDRACACRATPAGRAGASFPVDAVLIGRRNNPPEAAAGIRDLAVYNPIHYQELPEFFMDFICSLTGKSPSTTGAG